jgi:hypothetical protein
VRVKSPSILKLGFLLWGERACVIAREEYNTDPPWTTAGAQVNSPRAHSTHLTHTITFLSRLPVEAEPKIPGGRSTPFPPNGVSPSGRKRPLRNPAFEIFVNLIAFYGFYHLCDDASMQLNNLMLIVVVCNGIMVFQSVVYNAKCDVLSGIEKRMLGSGLAGCSVLSHSVSLEQIH